MALYQVCRFKYIQQLIIITSILYIGLIQAALALQNNTDFSVVVLYSPETEYFVSILSDKFVKSSKLNTISFYAFNTNSIASEAYITKIHEKSDLFISVGIDGLDFAIKHHCKKPVIATLINSNHYWDVLNNNNPCPNRFVNGIFLEQPISRQFELALTIASLNNFPAKIGILISNQSEYMVDEITSMAEYYNVPLNLYKIKENENPAIGLKSIVSSSNIILTLPDSKVYNSNSIRPLFLGAFRNKVAVIGHSKSYVKVGALASIYQSKRQHADEVVMQMERSIENNSFIFNGSEKKDQYSVAVNYQAAHTLAIPIINSSELKELMETFRETER